jgi:hypothetical protein
MTWAWRQGILRRPTGIVAGTFTGPCHPARPSGQVVVKLGGSLLTVSGWPAAVTSLVASLGRPAVIVVGGGAVVDGVRSLDEAARLEPVIAHRLAIDALRITATSVAVSTGLALSAYPERERDGTVLDTPAWLDEAGRFAALPVGWHVTSDSIAAMVATSLCCPLVLVKRVPPPGDGGVRAAATAGWVDPYFPEAAAGVEWIEWAVPAGPATEPPSH